MLNVIDADSDDDVDDALALCEEHSRLPDPTRLAVPQMAQSLEIR